MNLRVAQTILGVFLVLALSACGQSATGSAANSTAGSADHGHSSSQNDHHDSGTAAGATGEAAPYDAQFIDSMVVHHNGAIMMAEQALRESERAEIKQLAQQIIDTQHKEVQQMSSWRESWYPGMQVTAGTGAHMGDMEISSDTSKPFDLRFIEAMTSHHQGAIDMAREAQTKAEHAELKQLAAAIIKAQEAEIAQLTTWKQQWFAQ